MHRRLLLALPLLPWLAAGTAHAQPMPMSGIAVTGAWSRASPPGIQEGVIYLTLLNRGPDDALIGASSPAAAKADLHISRMVNGVMEMRPVARLDLPTGKTVALKPESYHIMLVNLTKPLTAGEQFPVTLRFAHAAPMTVQVSVRALGAGAPMPGMSDMKAMPGMAPMPGMSPMQAKPGSTP